VGRVNSGIVHCLKTSLCCQQVYVCFHHPSFWRRLFSNVSCLSTINQVQKNLAIRSNPNDYWRNENNCYQKLL